MIAGINNVEADIQNPTLNRPINQLIIPVADPIVQAVEKTFEIISGKTIINTDTIINWRTV